MKTLLLIDANALVHRAFHALPPLTAPDGHLVQALYGISTILFKIWREDKPDYAVAFFDRPEPTYRTKEYKEYKATRVKAADELIEQIIKAHDLFSKFGIKTFEIPGYEADDLIGTTAEKFGGIKDLKVIILTGDLDALQLVSKDKVVVRTLKTGVSDTVIYDEKAVEERFALKPKQLIDYKALVGDSSDNIPGIPGVGPKTAAPLIKKYGSVEGIYKNLDKEPKIKEKFGSAKDDVLLYKKLVTIDRHAPLDIDKINDLAIGDFPPELADYFASLGFQSLVKRLGGDIAPEKKAELGSEVRKVAPTGLFEVGPSRAAKDSHVFIYKGEDLSKISTKTLVSDKVKLGFCLKDLVKSAQRIRTLIQGPYFDLGIGFFLLEPDFKKYDPDSIFKKFFKRDWTGSDEDYLFGYEFLKQRIDADGLRKVFEIEMSLIDVLAEMENTGIMINAAVLKKLLTDIDKEIVDLVKTIYDVAGEKINLNSPKQLSRLLFEKLGIGLEKIKKTKTGLQSTNIDALLSLRGRHPVIDYILKYREAFKVKSTYIEPILDLTGSDHRLRTEFIQTGAATGRLSSQNPNLQNIPAIGSDLNPADVKNWAYRLRSAFITEKGFNFAAFDYSQLELRILASVSGDKKMIEVFRTGGDIHSATASAVFKIPLDKVDSASRRIAKTLNFGIVYGMGADAFAKTAGVKREEARTFIAEYFKSFPGIKMWHEKIKDYGRVHGFVKNLNGRRRMVPAINYGKSRLAALDERIAINMPIQSLGADIIKLAMIMTQGKIHADKKLIGSARLLLSIHDELLFEVEEGIMRETAESIKEIMEGVYKLEVPLVVNVKTGKNWAEMG